MDNSVKNSRVLKSPQGFTLFEVMIAITVIAIVLTAVYQLHAQTISMNMNARFYTVAPLLAQGKMVEIETRQLNDLTDDSGNFGENYPDYFWQVAVEDFENEELGDTVNGLKKISVVVNRNEGGMVYEVVGYRYFR
ncbi:MAG: prepilin-type N-terminal cleavage/methylation domain-containing protein [Desulfobacterales bacterium]|nr:prepilin-type N-terminal cleavage/methylation domain-containing protein [Desulfobacterales bacterium]